MFGLGKNRSDLGKWIDDRGITQQWLAKKSGLGRNTIGDFCGPDGMRSPTSRTMQKIIKALREVDPSVRADQFWDL